MKFALAHIRRLYRQMSLREKWLCLIFLVTGCAIWGQSWGNRWAECQRARASAQVELATQQQWLERSADYSQRLSEALQRVDPDKTYSGAQLSGRIDNLLRQAGLAGQADIDPVRSRQGEVFNDHNIRVQLSDISIAQLIQINNLLKAETPYINILKVQLSANRRNPEELDARLEINSFDLSAQSSHN